MGRGIRGLSCQGGDNQIGERGTSTGNEVIAWTTVIMRTAGAATGRNVVIVRGCHRVEHWQRLAGAVERSQPVQGATLVGNGDQGGPLRGRITGTAHLLPLGARAVGIVNREAGVGIRVVGDIGIGAFGSALGDDALLVGGLGFVGTDPATAAAPAAFTQDVTRGIEA